MKKILVISVHPDDETLGCGGTLLKHAENGDTLYWLIVTEMKSKLGFSLEKIRQRKKEIEQVQKKYHFKKVVQLHLATTEIDQIPTRKLTQNISDVIQSIKPNVLYLPFKGDIHSDHRIVFDACLSCSKIFRYPFIQKILVMETISETEFAPAFNENAFIPNYFVDITPYLPKKLEIMNIYQSEIGKHPFPRNPQNITALATFRGAMSNCHYAESFMLIKEVWGL